jgi:hypothetical protein
MAKDKVYTADMGQPPQDVDGSSAGRPYKKNEKNVPEQPGSGITVKKLAKGGSASARADGCATKGKTKGTMIAMCGGGYAKGKK